MDNAIYAFTVPVFIKSLGGLKELLAKAQAHGLADRELLEARFAPDMFPFAKQVQVACDQAKGAAARLSGVEAPKHEDTEATIAELSARIDKVLAFLATVSEASFAGAAERQVTLPYAFLAGKYFKGLDYAREYALPNFFFHYTTAYDILRSKGVQIGKADFINGLQLYDIV